MPQNIQEIFLSIKEKKEKLKDLRAVCKEVLDSSIQFQEINEQLKTLREKRKRIIATVQEQCASELAKIEELSSDISSDEEMMADAAINQYMKGESIEVTDQYENKYYPVFTVKFKKIN
jgi:uncharacterized coiled-coil DUF342 family protein